MSTRVISTCIQFVDAFSAPSKQTIKSMQAMAREAKATGKTLQNVGGSITSAGQTLTKSVTAPVVAIGTAAVKTAADYESAMSNVSAITGATGKDFETLKQLGKDLGATTAWSAQEVAQAMQYTGMAGWSAADNVAGLAGILNLASASGTDLASTSDIMTDAISAFGDTASDAGRYADVMTAACTSANVSVETLGESYKYAASVCGTMGYSVEDATTALAAMGNMGIKGSSAGTSLKNAITSLAAPTSSAKKTMDQLGISLTNSDGSMKSLGEVIGNLKTSFSTLSETEQAAAAKTLFGKNAMTGMLAVINTSTEDYNALSDAITNSSNAAQQAADTQLDNLNGQLTLLKSALEGTAITIGDKLLPYIKNAVQWVQNITDKFNGLSSEQVGQIIKWAGIAAAIGPALMVFGKVVTTVGKVYTAFSTITGAIAKAGGVMALVTSPAGIVVIVLAAVATAALLIVTHWDKVKPVLQKVKAAFMDVFPYIKSVISTVVAAVQPIIQTLISTFQAVLPKAINAAKVAFAAIAPFIRSGVNTIKTIVPIIAQTFVGVAQRLSPVIKTILSVIRAAIPIIGKAFGAAFTFAGNVIAKVMPYVTRIANAIGSALVYAIQKVSPILQKMASTFSAVFNSVFTIVSNIVTKLKPVFSAIGTVIKVVARIVKTEIKAAFTIAESVIQSTVGSIKTIIDGLAKVFSGLLDFITGVFTGNWRQAWEGVKNIFGGAFQALAGLCKVPMNAVIGVINAAIRGINSISVDIPEGIPLVGGKHIGFNIPTIPALAKGTPDWIGGLAQINEKGGEIVDLPKGSRVYPHDESVSLAKNTSNAQLSTISNRLAKLENGGGKGNQEINITIPKLAETITVRDESDIDEIAERLATNLKNVALNMGVC